MPSASVPTAPSSASRRMSAWPACRLVSASRWTRMLNKGTSASLPPGHAARGIEGEGLHRRVAVVPHPSVAVDDVAAGLALGRPHVGESLGLDVPARQGFGKGTVEDLAEVPGLPGRQVLDQAQQVGPGDGQRATDVVLGEPVELGEHRLALVLQVVVQVGLRGVVNHGTAPCHQCHQVAADPSQALVDGNGFPQAKPRTRTSKVSVRAPFRGFGKTRPVKILSSSNKPAPSPVLRFGKQPQFGRSGRSSPCRA